MSRIYPEQLGAQLQDGLRACYFILGNEQLLIQESLDLIRQRARAHGFDEQFSATLDPHTDWDALFSRSQSMSLFASRQILTLTLPDNGVNAAMGERLSQLATLLHPDLLLLLRGPRLTRTQENAAWYKQLSPQATLVSCQTPEQTQLPRWVANRARQMQLQLDEAALQLLCYCYEGNLLALTQALGRLSLLYPDGRLTLPRVEQAVNDAAHFSPFHWLDACLAARSKRAWHILNQLRQEGCEPIVLVRTVQRELLLLLQLKGGAAQTPLRTLFDKHKVWQNRRPLLTQAMQTLSLPQLHQAVALLSQCEQIIKQDFGQSVWPQLESLTLLLCGKTLPESMLHVE
ncbi:DNA polymerase III subunit delta [Edwardsiella ictaluri]|uniref:DNA polymerase III subunit delta n=1 Tax=Edwardsiella ictaluri TaxID=67780 RepID=UPI0009BF4F74|nr:DNA polymerase III subunit delta [Edwardsiella ictaluri]ARD39093.1 DNA polymerase III subunit delta [Edwardsiella ictaluri]QPW27523.1 DNA polymerase III subunit delta [Edwardsiella ictaluri]